MKNKFLNRLNNTHFEILENMFSKLSDGFDVKIINSELNDDEYDVLVEDDFYCTLNDFDLDPVKDEEFCLAYCTFMAHVFKEEYIDESIKYWNNLKKQAHEEYDSWIKNMDTKEALKIFMTVHHTPYDEVESRKHNVEYYDKIYNTLEKEYNIITKNNNLEKNL